MASIKTWDDYKTEPQHIEFERMAAIHRKMAAAVQAEPEAVEYYMDLLNVATKYANIRAAWATMNREEKLERDGRRTSLHDSAITNLNMLVRLLELQGGDTSWREELGDENEGYGRKALGDFACYLAFVAGVNAR